jgi:hypothetical protein
VGPWTLADQAGAVVHTGDRSWHAPWSSPPQGPGWAAAARRSRQAAAAGLYTAAASEDFILDRQGPFVVCSPCSGHGAKFAPLAGMIAADLACGGTTAEPRFTLAAHCG